jgi:hypothetical protein
MPSQLLNLLADAPGVKYSWYRFEFGQGLNAWVTSITNRTLGTLWFPLKGLEYVNVQDPSTVVQLDSSYSGAPPLSPEQLQAVYGSPIPQCPVNIAVIAAVPDAGVSAPDPEGFPDPLPVPSKDEADAPAPTGMFDDPIEQAGGDVSDPLSGPALPYMQVEVEYILATAVDFVPAIRTTQRPPVQDDGCGRHFYLTGGNITLAAMVDALVTANPVIATTYTWHVTGAQVVAGMVEKSTTMPIISLQLATPGAVLIAVDVTVQTTVGSGIQTLQQSTSRSTQISLLVLSETEAEMARVLCKLWLDTLPIRRLVFPGDPAEHLSRTAAEKLRAGGIRVQKDAETLARLLDAVLRSRLLAV